MRLLLDTHALLWWLLGAAGLSTAAGAAISDEANEVYVSAASAWEISTKQRLGKLPGAEKLVAELPGILTTQGFESLPITLRHGLAAGRLPGPQRGPFDRMLMAQAMLENMVLVSKKEPFDAYGVNRLW